MATITALGIGSGMDLNGLVDQLAAAERQKLTPIAQQRQGVESKISAYGRLEGALSAFQVATSQLNDAKLYQGVGSEVTGSALKAAAANTAAPGRYQVEVTDLASAYSVATAGVADQEAELGAGSLNFTLGNGETFSVDIAAGQSSLQEVRDVINAQDAGVQATIVNDGDPNAPWRLALVSTETGTEAAISDLQVGGDLATQLQLDATTEVAATNASLKVNAVTITSQSNRVEDAIQGVTLDLTETGSATVDVSLDTESIKKAVQGFVDAYNTLQSSMAKMTRFNAETGDAGALLGDGVLRRVQTQLRSELTGGVGEGEFRMLSQVGISVELDGSLKLDGDRLDEVVASNLDDLQAFFAGSSEEGGMAGKLDTTLDQMLGSGGALSVATDGLKSTVRSLENRYERMEASIDSTVARYRSQFAKLDSMISEMNSMSGYLSQQFDVMNAQLGRKK
ncbi:flagellar filament capping protein FliD [Halomonas marinisediminis]|uniref:Flagellar hook-associated protein 2 n=2 Tax=Gammaproteobacteria TaxID=1236 RepID=A0ABY2D5J6_9GAMM|nr:flagellar filament capping protein FliD [Halomonas marinisediminis]TDB01955.1 flagellar filament capping protein FliD [Halomonas marinisediminis]